MAKTRDERTLDSYFRRRIEASGALVYRMDKTRGWPDAIVFWPESNTKVPRAVEMVELKDLRGKLEPMQEVIHDRLRSRGHEVVVLRGMQSVLSWLRLRGVVE